MKNIFSRDFTLFAIIAVPFIYLAIIWSSLPDIVPIHWNIRGEIDDTGSKNMLILIPILLPLLTYFIFWLVPTIDPKKQISRMGGKYDKVKFWLTTFMAILATYILYVTKNESMASPKGVFIMMGILYLLMGNYFKTIKSNYFIGIRTPWTLENETVWKKTHKMAGLLWVVGGLLVVLCALAFETALSFPIFLTITLLLVLIPVGYSFWLFKNGTLD